MERGSDKHGPATDDQLAHEVEGLLRGDHGTHVEEWKDPEPSGEDQPTADLGAGGPLPGGTPDGMVDGDVEGRSELAQTLGPGAFPATGTELTSLARDRQATDRLVEELTGLDPDATYRNAGEVWAALGGHAEQHRN